MPKFSRRSFLAGVAVTGAVSQFPALAPTTAAGSPSALDAGVSLRWLEGGVPPAVVGTTWGVPWPRGTLTRGQELPLTTATGTAVPVLKPIGEASFVSTNASSQYGLAAIRCLALIGDHLP